MPSARAWDAALAAHDVAVTAFVAEVRRVPAGAWHAPYAPGKWTPAEESLHVALSYEMGVAALATGATMQPRVTPARARLLRLVLLPVIFRTDWFATGARAPREVRPPESSARELTPDAVVARLEDAAQRMRESIRGASQDFRFMHAYFGGLPAHDAVRMLSAHTRHHARAMARRATDTRR
jgi:hypothetical protein